MKRLVFSPAARTDLREILAYTAEDNPVRALSFVAELEAKAFQTAQRPLSFPARDDLSKGIRSARHGRYLILFRDLPDVVRIVRVVHMARNLALMGEQGLLS
jgi:toxin ParE1/3/4